MALKTNNFQPKIARPMVFKANLQPRTAVSFSYLKKKSPRSSSLVLMASTDRSSSLSCCTQAEVNFYNVLGVSERASPLQILDAYYDKKRELLRRKSDGNVVDVEVEIMDLEWAFTVLKNPQFRSQYDRELGLKPRMSGWSS